MTSSYVFCLIARNANLHLPTPHPYSGEIVKMAIPSATMAHFRGGRASIDINSYPNLDDFFEDLAAAYRAGELFRRSDVIHLFFAISDALIPRSQRSRPSPMQDASSSSSTIPTSPTSAI